MIYISGSQPWGDFAPREHLAIFGDIFSCHKEWGGVAWNGQRPGLLLKFLQAHDSLPLQRIIWRKMSLVLRLRSPSLYGPKESADNYIPYIVDELSVTENWCYVYIKMSKEISTFHREPLLFSVVQQSSRAWPWQRLWTDKGSYRKALIIYVTRWEQSNSAHRLLMWKSKSGCKGTLQKACLFKRERLGFVLFCPLPCLGRNTAVQQSAQSAPHAPLKPALTKELGKSSC